MTARILADPQSEGKIPRPDPGQALAEHLSRGFNGFTQDSEDSLDTQDLERNIRNAELIPDRTLPLDRYVEEAGRAEVAWMEQQEAGYETVDWKAGWHFVRLLKCHPELRNLTAFDALAKSRAAIQRASRRRQLYLSSPESAFNEVIGGFLTDTTDEFDAHFIRNWRAIRFLPGESPLDTALHLASRYPLSTHTAKGEVLGQYRRLVSIAGWLQYVVGDKNILLPVHTLAPHLGCSPRSVSSYIKMAEEEEILKRVKRYSSVTKRAHEFRFRTGDWQILRDGPP